MSSSDPQDARAVAELIDRLGRLLRSESHAEGLIPAQREAIRYLARCNRFSNTAGALARSLGATKGTVSQTLNALERKGLIARTPDPTSRRIVRLTLTAAGRVLTARDPLRHLSDAAAALPADALATTVGSLTALLASMAAGNKNPFGVCRTCRHFRPGAGQPHWCALLNEALSEQDSAAICIDHAA